MEENPEQKKQLNTANDGAETLMADGLMVDQESPPAYGEHHDHIKFSQPGFAAGAEATGNNSLRCNTRVDVLIQRISRSKREVLVHV